MLRGDINSEIHVSSVGMWAVRVVVYGTGGWLSRAVVVVLVRATHPIFGWGGNRTLTTALFSQ